MRRYGTLDFANKISFKTLIKTINIAQEQNIRDELYQMYCAILPNFDKKNYMTFTQFYEKYKPREKQKAKLDNRSEKELMRELLEIERNFKERSINGTF